MSNKLNKKLDKVNKFTFPIIKNNKIYNNNLDLKFWDEIFDDEEGIVYGICVDAMHQYTTEANNTMKIPNRHGKRNGNK